MKYVGETKLLMPATDENGRRSWIQLTLNAPDGIDRRRIKRIVRQFVKSNFGASMDDTYWRNVQIVNQYKNRQVKIPQRVLNEMVEAWIERLEADADTNEQNTGSQDETSKGSVGSLCFMPD